MLPFPPSNSGSVRKYQCYICASIHETYQEFRDHIVDEHEEGREYLKCPLPHCNGVVRDLREHFKNKHPHSILPPNIQLRATIWYDIRQPKRKKKLSFAEGNFLSNKNGKSIHYRSGYELKVYQILEQLSEVAGYIEEPYKIDYFYRGRQRTYIPDLLVNFIDGRQELWEIKPENQKSFPQNKAKWDSAKIHCMARGIKFEVITESVIEKLNSNINE